MTSSMIRAEVTRSERAPISLYRMLLLSSVTVNAVAVAVTFARPDVRLDDGSALRTLSSLTLVNLALAVLVRQQWFLNPLHDLAGRTPRSWPLPIRRLISNVHHIGGIHAGCAMSGTVTMALFTWSAMVTRTQRPAALSIVTVALSITISALLVAMVCCAAPFVRARAHGVFELTHRWGGWSAIALYVILTLQVAGWGRTDAGARHALVGDWQAWTVLLLVVSIAAPWLRLRRVPVTVERPSRHVAIVTFDHGVGPACSSAVGISRRPLDEWHAFATVTTPGRPGFRLLISRAGDWTGRFIDDPPTHVWLRGVPVSAPMAKVAVLYERVVYVVTGSGIGPCLGQILADRVPARLVWSTRNPRRTYGDALVDEVMAVQPDAVIWDTTEQGTPDLLQLALDAVDDFRAEAVFIVSNKPTTLGLVDELGRRGIPAFGPIWDS